MVGSTLVYGVGLNDAGYITQKFERIDGKQRLAWSCPFYQAWKHMLKRAYCKLYAAKHPAYEGVTVCSEWLVFSSFAAWMSRQDWEGKQLDKDLLIPGNREYGPDACAFVSNKVNSMLTNCSRDAGRFLTGVYRRASENKFRARARSDGEHIFLGSFFTELEAHAAWQAFKADEIEREALAMTDQRVAQAMLYRAARLRSDRAGGVATTQL